VPSPHWSEVQGSIKKIFFLYLFRFLVVLRREKEYKERVRSLEDLLGAVHFHFVAWYLESSLLAGAGVETSERALRERIVCRGERFPVGLSGPPGLHLIVEEGRGELSINSLSRAFLQLVPVRLFGTGQAAHIHEEKKRGGSSMTLRVTVEEGHKWKLPMLL